MTERDCFVYCWTNLDNNKKYVGYHKGKIDDGYICSSRSEIFWQDWKNCKWKRQIIAEGNMEECVKLEKIILENIDISSDEWYNNSRGGSIVFTEEVRKKMRREFSEEHKQKLSDRKKGRKISEQHKKKLREGRMNAPRNITSESMKKMWAKKKLEGFQWSDEVKSKMGRKSKPITIDGVLYDSRKQASKILNVSIKTIDRRKDKL